VGSRPSGDGFSCVGLVEAAYEDADLNIVVFPEGLGLLPIQQFNKTLPVDDITTQVDEAVSIPVRGVLDVDPGWGEDYDDDPDLFNITATNLPTGATFTDGVFEWTPSCLHANNTFNVDFEVESEDGSISVSQNLRIQVIGDACDGETALTATLSYSAGDLNHVDVGPLTIRSEFNEPLGDTPEIDISRPYGIGPNEKRDMTDVSGGSKTIWEYIFWIEREGTIEGPFVWIDGEYTIAFNNAADEAGNEVEDPIPNPAKPEPKFQ